MSAFIQTNILQRFGGQQYQRNWRKRKNAEPRQIAGRSSSPQQLADDHVHGVRVHGIEISYNWPDGSGQVQQRPSPPPRRRFMKNNLRHSVEMEYNRPLGWITRTSDGKFVIKGQYHAGGGYEAKISPNDQLHAYDLTPSNQPSVRGSFRSDGSGQSGPQLPQIQQPQIPPHKPLNRTSLTHSSLPPIGMRAYRFDNISSSNLMPSQISSSHMSSGQISTVFHPKADRTFTTSSPITTSFGSMSGYVPADSLLINEEISSVRNGSSFERSSQSSYLPPHLSSTSLRSQLHELPSLRPIHEHLYYLRQQQLQQQQQQQQHQYLPSTLRATVPLPRQNMPYYRTNKPLHGPLLLETVPEAIYDYESAPSTGQSRSIWPSDPRQLSPPRRPPQRLPPPPPGTTWSSLMNRPYQNLPFPRHLIHMSYDQVYIINIFIYILLNIFSIFRFKKIKKKLNFQDQKRLIKSLILLHRHHLLHRRHHAYHQQNHLKMMMIKLKVMIITIL